MFLIIKLGDIADLFQNKLIHSVILLFLMFLLLKILDWLFCHEIKGKKAINLSFLKSCIQAVVVVAIGYKIFSQSDFFKGFFTTILASSSFIIVVLGFIFKEGLSNIVHGFIISIFKPFNIGDRVKVEYSGKVISGYINSIDLRSTVIQSVTNSSSVLVPNFIMNNAIIENSHYNDGVATNWLEVCISHYSSAETVKKAIEILEKIIAEHPLYVDKRTTEEMESKTLVDVAVREISLYGFHITANVITNTIEENFRACSELKLSIIEEFEKNEILFARKDFI